VLIQALATKTPPATNTLTAETLLALSLLDVKCIGSLEDIRAFDLKGEIVESEKLARIVEAALKSASGSQTNKIVEPPPAKSVKQP